MTDLWKWNLWDPYLNENYRLEVNPNEEDMDRKRNFTYDRTASPLGTPVVYEGTPDPPSITLTGTLISQDQYQAMDAWSQKKYQIMVTDDLQRNRWMISSEWSPKRKWAVNHPWRSDWTWTLLLVSWGNPPSFGIVPEPGSVPAAPTVTVRQVGDDGRGNGYVQVAYSGAGSPTPTYEVFAAEGAEPDAMVWSDQQPGSQVFLVPQGVTVVYHVTAVNTNGSTDSGVHPITVT